MPDSMDTIKQMSTANDVLEFWRQAGEEKWFGKDPVFDEEFR